jgi:hypothetical protein
MSTSSSSHKKAKRSRENSESSNDEIIATVQSGSLLLPAAVLGHYSDVVDWKSYVTATGSEHVDDILKFTAGNEYSQQITSSIVRDVHGISQVVWRSKEVCKSASTLVDKNIAALEQQLAIAREAKENINNVGAKLVQMEKLCNADLLAVEDYNEHVITLLCNKVAWTHPRTHLADIRKALKIHTMEDAKKLGKLAAHLLDVMSFKEFAEGRAFQENMTSLVQDKVFARQSFKAHIVQRLCKFNDATAQALIGLYLDLEGCRDPFDNQGLKFETTTKAGGSPWVGSVDQMSQHHFVPPSPLIATQSLHQHVQGVAAPTPPRGPSATIFSFHSPSSSHVPQQQQQPIQQAASAPAASPLFSIGSTTPLSNNRRIA